MLDEIDTGAVDRRSGEFFQLLTDGSNFDEFLHEAGLRVDKCLPFEIFGQLEVGVIFGIVGKADGAHETDYFRDSPRVGLVLDDFISVPEYDLIRKPVGELGLT